MKRGRLLLGLGIACLIFLGGCAVLQKRLLYYPTKTTTVDELLSPGLKAWPTPADFRGLVAEPAGQARATVIVFHGNAGHAGDRQYYAGALTRLGLRVILAEYPGYGPRGGALAEASLVADGEQTLTLAHRQYGAPVLIIGESLGAAVAAGVGAGHQDKIAGLLLLTPWDRLEHVAAYHFPWLPVKWLLRDRYDTLGRLAGFARPVFVAVAGSDRTVPSRYGLALHTGLTAPKRLAVIGGADHNEWIDHVDERWWKEAVAFLLGGAKTVSHKR